MASSNDTADLNTTIIPSVDILYATIALVCFLVGTSGNTLTFCYVICKKSTLPTIIYRFITFVDLLVCILILPVSVSYFNNRNATMFGNAIFCNVWSVMWYSSTRATIFLTAALSITRTIALVFPFKRINKTLIIILFVFIFVF